jgi:hypothetical protein
LLLVEVLSEGCFLLLGWKGKITDQTGLTLPVAAAVADRYITFMRLNLEIRRGIEMDSEAVFRIR